MTVVPAAPGTYLLDPRDGARHPVIAFEVLGASAHAILAMPRPEAVARHAVLFPDGRITDRQCGVTFADQAEWEAFLAVKGFGWTPPNKAGAATFDSPPPAAPGHTDLMVTPEAIEEATADVTDTGSGLSDQALRDLDISTRAANALEKAGAVSLADVAAMPREDVEAVPGVSKAAVEVIHAALEMRGADFGTALMPPEAAAPLPEDDGLGDVL